jgi:DNA-binding MarR family transcriptional regulator
MSELKQNEALLHTFIKSTQLIGSGNHHKFGHGLHPGKGRILEILSEQGSVGQKELTHILKVRPPSISEMLHKMEAHGLITRAKTDEDKRNVTITITDKGRAFAEKIKGYDARVSEELFASLSQEEQETLAVLLGKLVDKWQKDRDEYDKLKKRFEEREPDAPAHHGRPEGRGHGGPEGHGHGRPEGCGHGKPERREHGGSEAHDGKPDNK